MQTLSLESWLEALSSGKRSLVMVGATGHLILSPEEEAKAIAELERQVAPVLAAADPESDLMVVTGMAPGADLLFGEFAKEWVAREGRGLRRVALLPVPVEVLWNDWRARAGALDAVTMAGGRERFDRALRTCEATVQLWPEAAPDWSDLAVRQFQYRRLAATLAEQSDVLVAIVKSGHAGQPGGALEVIAWRHEPSTVPPELSSGTRRHRSGWSESDTLIHIDPAVSARAPESANVAINRVRQALREGNYLLGYDRVLKAEQLGHRSNELTYLKLQTLANAGSVQAALRRFQALPAELRGLNEDWLALEGRLYKDLALAGGPDAVENFRLAASCYRAAFDKTGGYFSAINAATMALLGGEQGLSQRLAGDVLAKVRAQEPSGETDEYYLRVTEAEAALQVGDPAAAESALRRADRLIPDNLNARGRTRKQLRLVCRAVGVDEKIVQLLRMPPVVYLPPASPAALAALAKSTAEKGAFMYAGITRPVELELVESQMQPGSRLHLVLAAPRDSMLEHWSQAHGPDWSRRLAALIDQATEYSVARGFLEDEDAWSERYVDAMALGLSRLAAQRLGSEWYCPGFGSTAASLEESARAVWQQRTQTLVHDTRFDRRFVGLIFADFAGFSRLKDVDLPMFWVRFMHAIGEQLNAHRSNIMLQHSWGDALHVVTSTASEAAQLSCDIQDCVEQLRPSLPPALSRLELRLSAHFAPVFAGPNPIEGETTYFGTPLSLTARIEPVTPPGMIFVTEAFASQITLESPGAFTLEYSGDVTLAKAYGRSRLFNLRRRSNKPTA